MNKVKVCLKKKENLAQHPEGLTQARQYKYNTKHIKKQLLF